jgi:hypothetical protein
MLLPPFMRLVPENLPNAPTWFMPIFSTFNQFADRLNIIFRGNIDWSNITNEMRTLSATSGVPVTTTLQVMKTHPTIVLPVYSAGQNFTVAITGYANTLSPIVTVTNITNPTGAQIINLRFLP